MSEKKYAILLAGGSGTRMGAHINKILLPVAGIPCIVRSALALAPFVDHLILVGRPEEKEIIFSFFKKYDIPVPVTFSVGGETRQDSVYHGLNSIAQMEKEDAVILIHDGARCLVDENVIQSVLDSVIIRGTGIAAVPVIDTLREADCSNIAGRTIPRDHLWAMQTPQGARLNVLVKAFKIADKDHFIGTDDASVLAHAGIEVYLTYGSRLNLKLTTKEDIAMAESIINHHFPDYRVGQGYDVHQLTEGRKLILCGVEIPYHMGLLGHSDADVAVHALMDALLGAAGFGDIGHHFPDTDNQYKNIDSMYLLSKVMDLLHHSGFMPMNVDITIVAQKPKLSPYIDQMKEKLSSVLNLPVSRINVKATTTEKLGFEGRMEGISAQAVCLIQSSLTV